MKIKVETTQSSAIHSDANAGHVNLTPPSEDIKKKTKKLISKLAGRKSNEE